MWRENVYRRKLMFVHMYDIRIRRGSNQDLIYMKGVVKD